MKVVTLQLKLEAWFLFGPLLPLEVVPVFWVKIEKFYISMMQFSLNVLLYRSILQPDETFHRTEINYCSYLQNFM